CLSAPRIGAALWRFDQYHWFTALLTARGMQTAISRLVALCIAMFGLLPVGLMASRLGPQGLTTRVIAVVIAVGSLAMATLWLRD
ncbi:GGDEF domain-containing protein, partial [Mycobacterium sp. ITM-2017-0098]